MRRSARLAMLPRALHHPTPVRSAHSGTGTRSRTATAAPEATSRPCPNPILPQASAKRRRVGRSKTPAAHPMVIDAEKLVHSSTLTAVVPLATTNSEEVDPTTERTSFTTAPTGKVPISSRRKPATASSGDDNAPAASQHREPPHRWEQVLQGIEEMRAGRTAPVDSMGTEAFLDATLPAPVARFHVMVAAMLSSQTKDQVTAGAMDRLRARGLTVDSVLEMKESELAQLLKPVGFFNNKARFLKQACVALRDEHAGDIPDTLQGLQALPGIGPKMAYLIMTAAWGKTEGICVDVHVHRICNRLGWVHTWNKKNPKAQDPERTREELEQWLPRHLWGSINPLLVGFGQELCLPVQPKCDECRVRDLCPAGKRGGAL